MITQEGKGNRMVVPASLQIPLTEIFHKSPTLGSHAKQKVTSMHLQRYFYWKGMTTEVKSYCKNCEACLAGKNKTGKVPGFITQPRWPEGPFMRMHADTIRSLPTVDGYRHVLVVVDTYTKYVFTHPLRSGYPRCVVDGFTAIFTRFGQPSVLVMDNGGEFRNREIALFLGMWGVTWKFSSPYNPQANGQAEAAVKIISNRLRLTLLGASEPSNSFRGRSSVTKWTTILPYVTMSYNCSPNEATGFSPYELLFGRVPCLPSGSAEQLEEHEVTNEDYSDHLARLRVALREAHDLVDQTTATRRQLMKEIFDRRRSPLKIQAGDFVYLTRPFSDKLKKFAPRASGPFKVEGVSYHPETSEVVAVTVNITQPGEIEPTLKVYPRRRIRKLTARLPTVDWRGLHQQAKSSSEITEPMQVDDPPTQTAEATESEFLLFGAEDEGDTQDWPSVDLGD